MGRGSVGSAAVRVTRRMSRGWPEGFQRCSGTARDDGLGLHGGEAFPDGILGELGQAMYV